MATWPSGGVGTGYGNTSRITDVTAFIYQIVPEDKPFFHMTGEDKAYDPVHQWQQRTFTTRSYNALPRGFAFQFTTQNRLPSRNFNYTQIFGEEIRVSDTEKNTSHYAIDDLFSDQMQLALAVMGTNMEHGLLRGSLASGDGTAAVPQMQGIMMAVFSAASTYTTLLGGQLTEDMFNSAVQTLWEFGSEPRDVLVNGRLKRAISAFTASSTTVASTVNQVRYIAADEQRVVRTISEYQTDFWPAYIHLSRDVYGGSAVGTVTATSPVNILSQTLSSALFIDTTMIKKAWLQPVLAERTARVAHSTDGVLSAELTLDWGHPNAHAWLSFISA